MKTILFPGQHRQPSEAAYGIFIDNEAPMPLAHIVVWQVLGTHRGTSLWNTDEGRNNVLNRILGTDLAGIRTEFVRFTVALLEEGGRVRAMDFPIHVDVDDYTACGNPHEVLSSKPLSEAFNWLVNREKQVSIRSYDVVGGSARHYTVFPEGTPTENAAELLARAGYVRPASANIQTEDSGRTQRESDVPPPALVKKIEQQEARIRHLEREISQAKTLALEETMGALRAREIVVVYVGTDNEEVIAERLQRDFGPSAAEPILRHLRMLARTPLTEEHQQVARIALR